MPAIVRVKRRIDEEPHSAFVLNGKRRRVQDGEFAGAAINLDAAAAVKDEISTILKFAGTLEEQDDTATKHFVLQSKEAARELLQVRKPKNATERARTEVRQNQIESRFRVVNCLRTTLADTDAPKGLTILDIERHNDNSGLDVDATAVRGEASHIHHNNALIDDAPFQATDSDTSYVYDVYLPEDEQQAAHVDLLNDNYLSVRPFDDLIYEDCFNNVDDTDDSEDSNQENHVGNDYPDEDEYDDADDFESDVVRQMREAVATFVFDDEEDNEEEEKPAGEVSSSSDEDYNIFEDPYIHSVNTDSLSSDDVDRYGRAYARYKARILKQTNSDTSDMADEKNNGDEEMDSTKNDSDSDDSDDYYHSASENENDD